MGVSNFWMQSSAITHTTKFGQLARSWSDLDRGGRHRGRRSHGGCEPSPLGIGQRSILRIGLHACAGHPPPRRKQTVRLPHQTVAASGTRRARARVPARFPLFANDAGLRLRRAAMDVGCASKLETQRGASTSETNTIEPEPRGRIGWKRLRKRGSAARRRRATSMSSRPCSGPLLSSSLTSTFAPTPSK